MSTIAFHRAYLLKQAVEWRPISCSGLALRDDEETVGSTFKRVKIARIGGIVHSGEMRHQLNRRDGILEHEVGIILSSISMRPVPAVFHVHHEHGHSVLIGVGNHLGGVGIVPSDLHVRVVRVNTIVGIGIVVNLAHLGAIEVISVVNTRYGWVGIHRFNKSLDLLWTSGLIGEIGSLLYTIGINISVSVTIVVKLCDLCCGFMIYSGIHSKKACHCNQ